jgi:aminopeptidase YwaD
MSMLTLMLILAASVAAQTSPPAKPTQPARTPAKTEVKRAPARKPSATRPAAAVCSACIHAELEFLASDAMRGRGSATHDELLAATYIGAELRRFGVEPAGDNGGYVQTVNLTQQTASAPPVVTVHPPNGAETKWTHGQEILVLNLGGGPLSGPLQKVADPSVGVAVQKNAFVLIADRARCSQPNCFSEAERFASHGAAGILLPESPRLRERWEEVAKRLPSLPVRIEGASESTGMGGPSANLIALGNDALNTLSAISDGATFTVEIQFAPPQKSQTWNALGILRGTATSGETVLLSAHLDHLGVGQPVNGDDIYNGADDDASGCVAALQLARALGSAPRPKRTVLFAFFGSEERGGFGSRYFLEHPPVPITQIIANLEFEMIGRPDSAVKPDELWLTGYERSNLGPTLAQHGAKLVADPHPSENFFFRSDNIVLARRGVVAQTVSSFGLHEQYHKPNDDLAHIDFDHMEKAIGSMLEPVRWLANSGFKPAWLPGKQP